ncbi:hypothetical protein AAVH_24440, partial [Aphelenchoides avenae]
ALQESLLQWAVSYNVEDALTKAEGFAQQFVAECGESKSFSDCITLNVDILPAALCAGLKSKNDSVVKLVDAYEAFLTQDYVQKYIGKQVIVGDARRCAQRNAENLSSIRSRILLSPRKGGQGKVAYPTGALLSAIRTDVWRQAMEEVAVGL